MSFWSGLGQAVSGVTSFFGGNSLGSTLLKTAITGIGLHMVNRSIKAANRPAPVRDTSTEERPFRNDAPIVNRQLINADQSNKIPVVYGHAQLAGIITDAHMSNFNTRMTMVYTLSEQTGVRLSNNQPSVFTFRDIYYNDERLVFKTSGALAGIEVDHSLDRDGNRNDSYNGLIRVYCYRGNSETPVAPVGYTNAAIPAAYNVVPTWSTTHQMTDLVFAVAVIDYSVDKGSTSIGRFRFDISNNMTLPGDCMLDYMTNSRYGAGIPLEDILDE